MKIKITSFKEACIKKEGPSQEQWDKWSYEKQQAWLQKHPDSKYQPKEKPTGSDTGETPKTSEPKKDEPAKSEPKAQSSYKIKSDSPFSKRLANKSDEEIKNEVSSHPELLRLIDNPPDDLLIAVGSKNGLKSLKNPSDKVKLGVLANNGYELQNVENPTEEMKLAAVGSFPWAIQFINDPSEEVKTLAVEKEPATIGEIDNPSEELKMKAAPELILSHTNNPIMDNPSEEVQLAALQYAIDNQEKLGLGNDGDTYGFFFHNLKGTDISDKVFRIAEKLYPHNAFARDPNRCSSETRLRLLKKWPYGIINRIDNPTDEEKWTALKSTVGCIYSIPNPSEEMQLYAANHGASLRHIMDANPNPSKEVRLASLKNSANNFPEINNPSEEEQLALLDSPDENDDYEVQAYYRYGDHFDRLKALGDLSNLSDKVYDIIKNRLEAYEDSTMFYNTLNSSDTVNKGTKTKLMNALKPLIDNLNDMNADEASAVNNVKSFLSKYSKYI